MKKLIVENRYDAVMVNVEENFDIDEIARVLSSFEENWANFCANADYARAMGREVPEAPEHLDLPDILMRKGIACQSIPTPLVSKLDGWYLAPSPYEWVEGYNACDDQAYCTYTPVSFTEYTNLECLIEKEELKKYH